MTRQMTRQTTLHAPSLGVTFRIVARAVRAGAADYDLIAELTDSIARQHVPALADAPAFARLQGLVAKRGSAAEIAKLATGLARQFADETAA